MDDTTYLSAGLTCGLLLLIACIAVCAALSQRIQRRKNTNGNRTAVHAVPSVTVSTSSEPLPNNSPPSVTVSTSSEPLPNTSPPSVTVSTSSEPLPNNSPPSVTVSTSSEPLPNNSPPSVTVPSSSEPLPNTSPPATQHTNASANHVFDDMASMDETTTVYGAPPKYDDLILDDNLPGYNKLFPSVGSNIAET